MFNSRSCWWLVAWVLLANGLALLSDEPVTAEPEGHWPLGERIGPQVEEAVKVLHSTEGPGGRGATRFDGRTSAIRIRPEAVPQVGAGEFTVSLWVHADGPAGETPGDLVSCFDPQTRTGWQLGIYSHGGVTNAQSNSRQLHFGMDQDSIEPGFTDHGRLGTAVYPFSLCVHADRLYAATCHAGVAESGHVFRWETGDRWTDLGSPDRANAVSAMATFRGDLYVATSRYRLAGSALAESQNPHSGGAVYRLGADERWVFCGRLSPETEAVGSLVVYQDQLYAGSLYRPAGFFRYEGAEQWTSLPTPAGQRVEAMTVFQDRLYASSYDQAAVFCFDGQNWETVGQIPDATQTYGFAIYQGQLYVSEWPLARVFRYDGDRRWTDVGRLGAELESMPLLVYNGQMYGGTLPLAEVYRFDGPHQWKRIGRVDETPDVKYRRAWSMAVYRGRLFVGALPSGRVLSIEAGRNATWDSEFPTGWRHVAAVRRADRLELYVDGQRVAESAAFVGTDFDLATDQPLVIGRGAQTSFSGLLSDLRIERRALSPAEIASQSRPR